MTIGPTFQDIRRSSHVSTLVHHFKPHVRVTLEHLETYNVSAIVPVQLLDPDASSGAAIRLETFQLKDIFSDGLSYAKKITKGKAKCTYMVIIM